MERSFYFLLSCFSRPAEQPISRIFCDENNRKSKTQVLQRKPRCLALNIMADDIIDLPYRGEYAKSGRAACKMCKDKIDKGELRLAAMVQVSYIRFSSNHVLF